ncbi:MAG: tripartite tricarboxylate transporter substrate binding protein [Xanthobacteraceae bacterium]
MRFLRRIGVVVLVFALGSASARAQPYPNKPIHVVVPVTAGGLTDVIARRIAADASARIGQPWIMENRPGANFIPAAEACRHAKGDGYTLCVFTTSTVTFNPHLIEKLPYDAAKDFKPIINLGQFIGGLIASPKLGVKTIDDLRRLTLAKPGEFNFGTYGPASSANVFRQYLAERWNTPLVEVAYKGSNELIAALASGEIQMTWTALGSWAENPNDSKGRIVAIDGAKRSPLLPEVPIYAEAGLGNYPIHTWMGLFAPAETPDDVITQVNQVVGEAIREPKVIEFLVNQLIEPDVTTAPEFAAYVAREREETGALLRRFNIPKIQ